MIGIRNRVLWALATAALIALTTWTVIRVSSESSAASPPPRPKAEVQTPIPRLPPSGKAVVRNSCPAAATACVDEQLRLSWLQHDGKMTYGPVPVMPGTKGAKNSVGTPKGTFRVQWKDQHHVSSEFGEPMRNAVFFADGGIAFHEGSLVSSSHGCVHLSPKDSAHYFNALPVGAEVAVF